MSFFGDIAKVAKSVIKSPITKAVAGGAAIVFPAVGVPAVAAIATANQALSMAESGPAKAALGAAAKLRAKATIKSQARVQLKAGVPKAKVRATMVRKAHAVARKVAVKPALANKHRAELSAQLTRTKALAARGDKGAQRALATFKVVNAARKGDPKAKAAVALIAHRYEVGQRVRSRFELTSNGRIRARV